MPEIGEGKERPQECPEKWDVTADSAEQTPGPPTKAAAPTREPTSDLEEVIDVEWDDDASGANTDEHQ